MVELLTAKESKALYLESASERKELLLDKLSLEIKNASKLGNTKLAVDYEVYRPYTELLTSLGYWLSYSTESDCSDPEYMIIDWSFG